MSKTPEEMAEEYTRDWWGNLPEAEGMRKSARENFLAGYKAAAPQWISVKCYLPQPVNGQPALVLILQKGLNGWIHEIAYHYKGHYEWSNMLDEKIDNVHYWQELPEPPKEQQ